MNKLVLGTLYGDEGKGATVNALCKDLENPLVVRFNGGHQVGHTTVENGNRHVFSNFGSGTLLDVPTYWSEYCTVNPMGVKFEYEHLIDKCKPYVIYNANAMVTTPYDIKFNQSNDVNLSHGTVGVGFGATIQRNQNNYHLYVRDLLYPKIRDMKLDLIGRYYGYKNPVVLHKFIEACDFLVDNMLIVNSIKEIYKKNTDLVFEGGQGILLDMDYGFFPNVTRSNTTSKNAIEILKSLGIPPDFLSLDTYYVIRAYQTRHGNGFLSNEDMDISYIAENPLETNKTQQPQGVFRKSVLDLDFVNYAINCDSYYNKMSRKCLVVTCLDQVPNEFPMTIKNQMITGTCDSINLYVDVDTLYKSYSDTGFDKKL